MRMLHDGGGGGKKPSVKAPAKTRAQIEAEERSQRAAAALRKLQTSGSNSLTSSERVVLGMSQKAPSPSGSTNTTSSTVSAPSPVAAPINQAPIAAAPIAVVPPPTPPVQVEQAVEQTVTPKIKSAPIDTIQFVDDAFSEELIIDLLFQNIGGQEILSIARGDTVNGQPVVYQPIKNLGILQQTYNPARLLRIQETSDKFFSNFTIDLRTKIPNVGSGLNGKNYRIVEATGDLVVELVNMRSDEQVEIQIASDGIIENIGI